MLAGLYILFELKSSFTAPRDIVLAEYTNTSCLFRLF